MSLGSESLDGCVRDCHGAHHVAILAPRHPSRTPSHAQCSSRSASPFRANATRLKCRRPHTVQDQLHWGGDATPAPQLTDTSRAPLRILNPLPPWICEDSPHFGAERRAPVTVPWVCSIVSASVLSVATAVRGPHARRKGAPLRLACSCRGCAVNLSNYQVVTSTLPTCSRSPPFYLRVHRFVSALMTCLPHVAQRPITRGTRDRPEQYRPGSILTAAQLPHVSGCSVHPLAL